MLPLFLSATHGGLALRRKTFDMSDGLPLRTRRTLLWYNPFNGALCQISRRFMVPPSPYPTRSPVFMTLQSGLRLRRSANCLRHSSIFASTDATATSTLAKVYLISVKLIPSNFIRINFHVKYNLGVTRKILTLPLDFASSSFPNVSSSSAFRSS